MSEIGTMPTLSGEQWQINPARGGLTFAWVGVAARRGARACAAPGTATASVRRQPRRSAASRSPRVVAGSHTKDECRASTGSPGCIPAVGPDVGVASSANLRESEEPWRPLIHERRNGRSMRGIRLLHQRAPSQPELGERSPGQGGLSHFQRQRTGGSLAAALGLWCGPRLRPCARARSPIRSGLARLR